MDGALPTSDSPVYAGPLFLTNTVTLRANAFEPGFSNSVAATYVFNLLPGVNFLLSGLTTNGAFQVQLSGIAGKSYILQGSTDLSNWISLSTNSPVSSPFDLTDPMATNFLFRFYRAVQQP